MVVHEGLTPFERHVTHKRQIQKGKDLLLLLLAGWFAYHFIIKKGR